MEADRGSSEPTPEAAFAAASVLGDDDLLREILLRLDLPTSLVRAAAVSKRWLRRASDTAFLRRFRARHPPRLLGLYVSTGDSQRLRFVPLAQGPELAAVVRRGSFDLGDSARSVRDCRNGRLLVYVKGKFVVCSPLHPDRGTATLPQPPMPVDAYSILLNSVELLFHEDGGDGILCTAVTVLRDDRQAWVYSSDLQAGAWGESRASDRVDLPGEWRRCENFALLTCGKLYMICVAGHILGFDLPSASSFYIKLPDGVQYEYDANIGLSRAEGSGFCLIHVKGFQIRVWLHRTDSSTIGTWKLIDTICLPQAFGHLADPTWHSQHAVVHVVAVGDNAGFVFLRIQDIVFYMHISSRTVEKVYELTPSHGSLYGVHPFMMPWPPTFPALNGGHDEDQ